MRGDLEGIEPDAMARILVIEGEIAPGVPELAQAAFETDPSRIACGANGASSCAGSVCWADL